MRKLTSVLVVVLLLAIASWDTAFANSFSAGVSAYNRKDYVGAARRFLPLAERGHSGAQAYLGFMYSTGRGVPKNYVLAAWWSKRAAKQGEPGAQYLLGQLYDKGQGLPRDYVESYKWFNLSSAHAPKRARKPGALLREAVATKMTYEELYEAQLRSVEWTPVRERRH